MSTETNENNTMTVEDASESFICRQIIQEINRFGVNQNQMIQLIYLLTLELENNSLMSDIINIITKHRDGLQVEDKPKLEI